MGALGAPHTGLPVAQLVWVLVLASLTSVVAARFRFPYTVALVAVGLAVSALGLLSDVTPTSDVILLVFLPPLVFEAALQLDLQVIRRVLPVVLALAIPGVLLSTVLIGLPLARFTPLTIWSALLFGAAISATDPVAVVTVFRRLDVPAALTHAIEGESLFNDGTALVLATLLITAARTGHLDVATTIGLFLWSVAGGAAIGAAAGYLISEATGLIEDHLVEISLSAVLAYGSYLIADALRASGVIAVVLAGIVYGTHGRTTHLSAGARGPLDDFWEYVGFLANAMLFVLIGLSVRLHLLQQDLRWVIPAVLIVLAARAIVVYSLTLSLRRIPIQHGHLLFWGGLRGGVAIAVALSLPSTVPGRPLLLACTFGVVLFTILVQGLTVEAVARRLGVASRSGP